MHVYDVGPATFQPTFSPMTAPPPYTTLPPDPSQPTNRPGQSSSVGNPSITRSSGRATGTNTSQPPPSTSTGNGEPGLRGSSGSNKAAIAIGSVLGGLGFVAGAGLVVWYLRRRNARSGHAFSALDDDDEEHPHSITAVRIGGTREKGPRILAPLGLLGLGPSRRYMNRSRRDILADEDRSFNWVGVSREGSHGRSSLGGRSARSSIRGLSNAMTESFASIRNLARGVGPAPRSREVSADWEKMGGVSSEVALMAAGLGHDELPERTRNGFALPGPSQPYTDPFADQHASAEVLHDYDSEPEFQPNPSHSPERKEDRLSEARPPPLRTSLPPMADFVPLSPLVEQASQNSLSNSSSSHNTSSDKNTGSGSSHGATLSPRPSSILDPNPPSSQPVRRSNSWWARFAKTPLLERRGTESSARSTPGFIEFRDPNPPPRLLTIEESAHSQRSSEGPFDTTKSLRKPAASRAYSGTLSRRPSLYRDTMHGRSASSLQTANTETLERLGGTMDIIQRDGTLDSQYAPPTGGYPLDEELGIAASGSMGPGGISQLRALLVRGEPSYRSTRTASSSISIDSPRILSPLPSGPGTPTGELSDPASPPPEEAASSPAEGFVAAEDGIPHSPGVADRVRAFERRMSHENASPPPPTNTRRREERTTAVVTRPAVRYGLVPRPSLFVANPDGSRGSDGG
jgi:hypothetical protein